MSPDTKLTTTVSTKGQVILPKAIRHRKRWGVGMRLVIEEVADGLLLRPAPQFPETRPEDVFGSLPVNGPPKSLDEMDAGVLSEAKRRRARD